jgi:hypothetical protein
MTTLRRLLAAALVLTAIGCGGDDKTADTTTTADATTTTEAPTTTASTGECHAGDADPTELESLMVSDVAGFEQQTDDVGDTGPSDLAKAISDDGEDDAEQFLTDGGFRRGYQRLWSNDADEQVLVFLYEFCDSAGAAAYGQRGTDLVAASGLEVVPFETGGVGTGFTVDNQSLIVAFVVAPSDATLVQALAYAASGTDVTVLRQRAIDLATAQLALV